MFFIFFIVSQNLSILGNGGSHPNYEPNSHTDSPRQNNIVGTTFASEEISGRTGRHSYSLTDIDFFQAGELYHLMTPDQKDRLISNIAGHLKNAKLHIRQRQIANFARADKEYGRRVEEAILKAGAKV